MNGDKLENGGFFNGDFNFMKIEFIPTASNLDIFSKDSMFKINEKLRKTNEETVGPRFKFLSQFTKEYNECFYPKVKILFSNEGGFYFEEIDIGLNIKADYRKKNFGLQVYSKETKNLYALKNIIHNLNNLLSKYNIKLIS